VTAKFEESAGGFLQGCAILYPGQEIAGIQLDRLKRLGFVDGTPEQQGLYHLENGRLDR
jgi:hypothetical protein